MLAMRERWKHVNFVAHCVAVGDDSAVLRRMAQPSEQEAYHHARDAGQIFEEMGSLFMVALQEAEEELKRLQPGGDPAFANLKASAEASALEAARKKQQRLASESEVELRKEEEALREVQERYDQATTEEERQMISAQMAEIEVINELKSAERELREKHDEEVLQSEVTPRGIPCPQRCAHASETLTRRRTARIVRVCAAGESQPAVRQR